MKIRTAEEIIDAAAKTVDEPRSKDQIFNTVNDLLLRVTNQPDEVASLIQAQGILKFNRKIRHAADAREKGAAARVVLAGLIA